jgi:hypothetical protein
MAFSPGYKAYILLDGANGVGTNVSTYADDFSFPQSTEMLEVTTFSAAGTNSKRFIPGLNGGDTVSISGPLDSALHSQITGMKSAQDAGTAGFTVIYGPAGSVASAPKVTGEVYVASYEISSGVGGRNEYSASLQVDGAVANATW